VIAGIVGERERLQLLIDKEIKGERLVNRKRLCLGAIDQNYKQKTENRGADSSRQMGHS
jgi:hypothetical protein